MSTLLWMQHASFPGKQSHCVPIPCSWEEELTQGELANSVFPHVVNKVHFLFQPPPHRYITLRSTNLAPEMQKARGKEIILEAALLGRAAGPPQPVPSLRRISPSPRMFYSFQYSQIKDPRVKRSDERTQPQYTATEEE